jgi:hypothetical protein
MKVAAFFAVVVVVASQLSVAQQPHPLPAPQRPGAPPVKEVDPNAPRISSPAPTFDFGDMAQQDKVDHEFILENTGKSLLKINHVHSTCGCTVVQPTKNELAAGEKTTVKITFNSQTFNGPTTKQVVVDSNDPVTPRFNLTITGRVSQAFRTSVNEVNFGSLRKGTTFPPATFDILTPDALKGAVVDVQADVAFVKARFDRLPKGAPASGFRVVVEIVGAPPVGQLRGSLTIITDLAAQRQLSVPFVAQIDGEVEATPRQFTFGSIKAGDATVKEVRISKAGAADLKIEGLDFKVGGLFDAEIVKVKEGAEYVIKVKPAQGVKPGFQRETLTIRTNVPGEEAIPVYFYAIVK